MRQNNYDSAWLKPLESIFLYENTLTLAINFVKINIAVQQFTFATQGAVQASEELKVYLHSEMWLQKDKAFVYLRHWKSEI